MTTIKLIPLAEHASNMDRAAVLITTGPYKGRDIYKVRGGYLATIDDMAFDGLFATEQEARIAQNWGVA
jgi:hypothetical protein